MFREFIQKRLTERTGMLDPLEVASWIQQNFQTAWVHRKEDAELTRAGYKSKRGETLKDALAVYEKCEIKISQRPATKPLVVHVGDSDLYDDFADSPLQVGEGEATPPDMAPLGANYNQFFSALNEELTERQSPIWVVPRSGRNYAYAKGIDAPGVRCSVLRLEAGKETNLRTLVLSLESETFKAGQEPGTPGWIDLRDALFGAEWRVEYGKWEKADDKLCRYIRPLTPGFKIADGDARKEAARRAAAEIDAQWTILHR